MAMKNGDIAAAWAYHNGTKHSYQSLGAKPHYLDWENQPLPFKIYADLEAIPLPQSWSASAMSALSAIASVPATSAGGALVTAQSLAAMLFLSAGVTKRRSYPGGEMLFRAAACTGALYHIDLYVICGDLDGLPAGVYQFSPQDFSLRRLRGGDYRSVLSQASGAAETIVNAACVIVSASTYWRNAWKYQSRAYRHCYWDSGTLLANLLAAAAARNIPAKLVLGFIDGMVNQLLGLNPEREAALSLVGLGKTSAPAANLLAPLDPLRLDTLPLSKSAVVYPAMGAMHEASSLETEAEVVSWRAGAERASIAGTKSYGQKSRLFPLERLPGAELAQDTLDAVVMRRGSTREFARTSIEFSQLSTLLERATRGIDADFLSPTKPWLNQLYLIIHAVDGLPPGAYVYRRVEHALELLKPGDFRSLAGSLGLGQALAADCSVNVYFMADLTKVLACFGNRGYRAAQLEAAILGGKLYLAAYAQRLGASGLTFFDEDVINFFSPHAVGMSVMFLIALGKSVKQKKIQAG